MGVDVGWVEALGGQVAPSDREFLLSSASADQLLERAATLGQAEAGRLHGSHATGLNYVPFDGYRAELHKGERVQTAAQVRSDDSNAAAMLNEMRALAAGIRKVAESSKKTADLLTRVTRDGEALLTEAA